MKHTLLLYLIFISLQAFGQGPQVPSVIDFAGMKLHLNDAARRDIQTDVDNLRRYDKYFRAKLEKVDLHFPIIEKVLREENLPDDFKYLVIQESALVSDAVSSSNAVGYWQFKKETALEMNLRVDAEVDERLNLVASTRAAARYLKKNNFYFDNWVYALLAYNTGRGGAQKYVKERDFGKKRMEITGQTHWYVKKFLAHKIAFEGELAQNDNLPFFLFVYTPKSRQKIKDIADEFEVDYDMLLENNKCFKKKVVPDDKTYAVIIPIGFDRSNLIAQQNDNIYKTETKKEKSGSSILSVNKSGSPVKAYYSQADHFPVIKNADTEGIYLINGKKGVIAKPGDSFDLLALTGGISLSEFYKYNDLTQADKPKAGQVYYYQKKPNKAKTHYHTLLPGQTLWEVSQKYGVKLKKLLTKNRLKTENEAKAGLVLWLRYIRPGNVSPEFHDIRHFEKEKEKTPVETPVLPTEIVKTPDTASVATVSSVHISKEEKNETEEEIIEKDPENIEESPFFEDAQEPSNTQIVAGKTADTENKPEVRKSGHTVLHTVQKGDTYFSISRIYGVDISDLLEWNELSIHDVLSIGQELTIKNTASPAPSLASATPTDPENTTSENEYSSKETTVHTVSENDTLYGIAKKYGVTIKDIMEWNGKEDFGIRAGEELKIYHD